MKQVKDTKYYKKYTQLILGIEFIIIFGIFGIFIFNYIIKSGDCQLRIKHNGNYDSQKTPVECFKNINYQSK